MMVKWKAIKQFLDAKAICAQHLEDHENYYVIAVDGALAVTCVLSKLQGSDDLDDFETNYKPKSNFTAPFKPSPFSAKNIGNKKLFKRVHGIKQICTVGVNTLEYVIPYAEMKMTGIEVLWGNKGDTCSFKVYDTPAGLISGVPNYMLNQFGFDVNVAPDYYAHRAEFDADIYLDMKLSITYTATQEGVIGVNFILNELKL